MFGEVWGFGALVANNLSLSCIAVYNTIAGIAMSRRNETNQSLLIGLYYVIVYCAIKTETINATKSQIHQITPKFDE